MKCILILLAAIGFSAANANDLVQIQSTENSVAVRPEDAMAPTSGKTRFDEVKEWFAQGTPLTFEQFKGYYTGRCFDVDTKDTPENAMIGYHSQGTDAGPGFQPTETKVAGIRYGSGTPANYFDDAGSADANIVSLRNITEQHWANISPIFESPTLSYTYDWEANGRPDEKHEFVMHNGYIVDRWTALIKQKYGGVLRNPGDILYMCYFFERLDKN